ncbi:MAG: right-handed parallel beta-helix repeat-containing protein [Hahellaceae bacterium]|nr:right-handed parallel beta-helix repeat-containing protein [Hahellaceae bacterium]
MSSLLEALQLRRCVNHSRFLFLTFFLSALLLPYANAIAATNTIEWSGSVLVPVAGLKIKAGETLKILPGTIVKFESGASLTVELGASIEAISLPENPIVFTSVKDSSPYSLVLDNALKGSWGGISASSAKVLFSNVIVKYAGNPAVQTYAALSVLGSSEIKSSIVTGGLGAGIVVADYTSAGYVAVIEDTRVENNGGSGIVSFTTASASTALRISRSSISNNGQYGISSSASIDVSDSEVIGNQSAGLSLGGDFSVNTKVVRSEIAGNAFPISAPLAWLTPANFASNLWHDNLFSAAVANTSNLTADFTLGVLNAGESGELNTFILPQTIKVKADTKLTVNPGVNLKFGPGAGIQVKGSLDLKGEALRRITLTSVLDDSVGGDTNQDASASRPQSGDWLGVEILTPAHSSGIQFSDIRYAGSEKAAVIVTSSDLIMSDATVTNSATSGVLADSASLSLQTSQIYSNLLNGVALSGASSFIADDVKLFNNSGVGLFASGTSTGNMTNSELFANSVAGVRSLSSKALDVRGNWWGSEDGPSGFFGGTGEAALKEGTGDVVVSSLLNSPASSGTPYAWFDAGTRKFGGDIGSLQVVLGEYSDGWGDPSGKPVLFDSSKVSLSLDGAANLSDYALFVTSYTPEKGISKQRLRVGGYLANASLIPSRSPTTDRYAFQAQSADPTQISLEKSKGISATVSKVLVVGRAVDKATVSIDRPALTYYLTGSKIKLNGGLSHLPVDSVVSLQVKRTDTTLTLPVNQVTSDNRWSHDLTLGEAGTYEILATCELCIPSETQVVKVLDASLHRLDSLVATDVTGDTGSQLDLLWVHSHFDSYIPDFSYQIERRLAGTSAPFEPVAVVEGEHHYRDSSVSAGNQYEYRVSVLGAEHLQGMAIVTADPAVAIDNSVQDLTAPPDVQNLRVVALDKSVEVNWSTGGDPDGDLLAYLVDYSTDGGATWSASVERSKTDRRLMVSGLQNGLKVRVRVRTKDTASPANISAGAVSSDVTPVEGAVAEITSLGAGVTVIGPGVYHVNAKATLINSRNRIP